MRGRPVPKMLRIGTPTTTPIAYAEISSPACGTETCTPWATSGRMPIVWNSVVPMAKPPMVRASVARPALRVDAVTASAVATGAVIGSLSLSWVGRSG